MARREDPITVRCPADLLALLKARVEADKTTITAFVLKLLRAELEAPPPGVSEFDARTVATQAILDGVDPVGAVMDACGCPGGKVSLQLVLLLNNTFSGLDYHSIVVAKMAKS